MIVGREPQCPISLISSGDEVWARELRQIEGLEVEAYQDPWLLRQDLLSEPRGLRRVLVGTTLPIEPVNVAAAIARDGHARGVWLVAERPSGSLRSRAAHAMITRVVEPGEVLEALGITRSPIHMSPGPETALEVAPSGAPLPSASHPLPAPTDRGLAREEPLEVDEVAHQRLFLRALPTLEEAEAHGAFAAWGDDLEEPEFGGARDARSTSHSKRTPDAAHIHQAPGLGNVSSTQARLRHKPFSSRAQEARDGRYDVAGDTAYLPFSQGERSTRLPSPVAHARLGKDSPRLVLVSGRGGVGKSAIAALMAATAASWGMEVALVDLDLAFGNLFGYFGLDGPADLTPLADATLERELMRVGRQVGERLTLFGPCAKPEYAETVAPRTAEILDELSATYDLVVVDGGTSWGDAVAQATQMASRLLVCSDERAGAIGTLSRAGLLAQRLGVARTRICRLINRCDPRHRDEGFINRVDKGFETARQLSILEGGIEVGELMSAGHATELVDLPNDFSESVARHLALILSELGILPDDERARKAAGEKSRGKRGEVFPFFKALAS